MKAIRRSTLRTALLGTLAAAVLGFHGAASAQVAGTIKIDAPLSLTGVAAFAGIAEKEGMDYAIEEINSSRFLGDAKLAANYVDVALATDQAVTAVRGLLRGDGGSGWLAAWSRGKKRHHPALSHHWFHLPEALGASGKA